MAVLRGLIVDYHGLFDGTDGDRAGLLAMVSDVRAKNVRTALLTHADATWVPPRDLVAQLDVVVRADEVGLRKSEPVLFELTARRLGLTPHECVFVDDTVHYVHTAVQAGMVGVVHSSITLTLDEVSVLFDYAR